MMQMLNVESQLSSRNKKQKIVMVCCSWIHKQKELENKMFKRKYETNWIWDIKRKKKNLKTKDENLQKNETYLNF
jgi:formaldehyde-activating enzyme involved in methanogenesis